MRPARTRQAPAHLREAYELDLPFESTTIGGAESLEKPGDGRQPSAAIRKIQIRIAGVRSLLLLDLPLLPSKMLKCWHQ